MPLRFAALAAAFSMVAMGCGVLLSTDESDSPPSAVPNDGGAGTSADGGTLGGDGFTPRGACAWDSKFGEPRALTELNIGAAQELDPRLANNELTIYFTCADGFGNHLFTSRRSSLDAPFAAPTELTEFLGSVGQPSVSEDDRVLLFGRHTGITVLTRQWDIFRATRATRDEPWGNFTPIVTGFGDDVTAYLVGADTFYFAAETPFRMFKSPLPPTGERTEIVVPGINAQPVASPVVSADKLTMWFTTIVNGGNYEMMVTHRDDPNAAFGEPRFLTELNTAATEISGYISADQCRFYFARGVGFGNQGDLFVVSR